MADFEQNILVPCVMPARSSRASHAGPFDPRLLNSSLGFPRAAASAPPARSRVIRSGWLGRALRRKSQLFGSQL